MLPHDDRYADLLPEPQGEQHLKEHSNEGVAITSS